MSQRAENEGFRLLDDFVCEASHEPTTPKADQKQQGRNEGMLVLEERVFAIPAGEPEQGQTAVPDLRKPMQPSTVEQTLQRLVEELAALLASQADPSRIMDQFQNQLATRINALQEAARASPQGNGGVRREGSTNQENSADPGSRTDQPGN